MVLNYYAPMSVTEAVYLLQKQNGIPIAGGTDSVPQLKEGKLNKDVDSLISLNKILELKNIEETSNEIRIGALVTHSQISNSAIIRKYALALAEACSKVASQQIRNQGTLGGNVCNGTPCADSLAPLFAFDAKILITGPEGERKIPISHFYLGPARNSLIKGQLVKSLIIPKHSPNTKSSYIKHSLRSSMDFGWLNVAIVVEIDDNGICQNLKIAIASLDLIPKRLDKTEKFFIGRVVDQDFVNLIGEKCREEAGPKRDFIDRIDKRGWEIVLACKKCPKCRLCRTDLDYRREMVSVIVRRSLENALTDWRKYYV